MRKATILLLTALSTIYALTNLEEFCITILKQSTDDTNMCAQRPASYSFGDTRDDALLSYICCLAAFEDSIMTINYKPYLNNTFYEFVSYQKDAIVLKNIANFVYLCTQNATKLPILTPGNFLYWGNHSHTFEDCRGV